MIYNTQKKLLIKKTWMAIVSEIFLFLPVACISAKTIQRSLIQNPVNV